MTKIRSKSNKDSYQHILPKTEITFPLKIQVYYVTNSYSSMPIMISTPKHKYTYMALNARLGLLHRNGPSTVTSLLPF